jgi:hypothetical protein
VGDGRRLCAVCVSAIPQAHLLIVLNVAGATITASAGGIPFGLFSPHESPPTWASLVMLAMQQVDE